MFRSMPVAIAVATLILVPGATTAQAETVSGQVTNSQPGMKILLVANDGSSVSATVKSNGKFTLRGSKRVMRKVFPKKGPGPTLHLLRQDMYAGPVLLGVKSKTRGYARLLVKGPKKLNLGKMTVQPKGYVSVRKPVSPKALDTKRTVKLRKKVPLGAGTQGATGRLASTAAVRSKVASALPNNQTGLGADADGDGVPNLADVDMNGDQVLDAAQLAEPETTAAGQPLGGVQVLANRPFKTANVEKILNTSWTRSVNSNVNTDVTWEELTAYLSEELTISTFVESNGLRQLFCPSDSAESPCDLVSKVAAVEVNCQLLNYCGPASQAIVVLPTPGFDRRPLRELLLPNGAFPLLDRSEPGQRYFTMAFAPNVVNQANLMLVGDSYEFVLKDSAGNELGRQVSVMSSSVATAPEVVSVAGQPYPPAGDSRQPVVLTPEQAQVLTLEFYRPQRLNSQDMSSPAPVLLDRGGLEYGFSVRAVGNPGATGYSCRSEQVSSPSPDLVALEPGPGPGGVKVARFYDQNVSPANGTPLTFQINLADCLSNPAGGPSTPPPPGSSLVVEIGTFDSDSNRTGSMVNLKLP